MLNLRVNTKVRISAAGEGGAIGHVEDIAGKSGVQYQTLLKRLIGDGLSSMERAARLKDWK